MALGLCPKPDRSELLPPSRREADAGTERRTTPPTRNTTMTRDYYSTMREVRGWLAAEVSRGTPHHEILQELLIEPRFEKAFSHIDIEDDPEALRREAVDLLNTAIDQAGEEAAA